MSSGDLSFTILVTRSCFGSETLAKDRPSAASLVGMANMRAVMPALQKAKPTKLATEGLSFASVSLPKQLRVTKIVKDKSPDDIAREIVEWIKK